MLGKLVHLTADALIISAFLAGIKRSTGLTSVPSSPLAVALVLTLTVLCLSSPALDKVPSKDLRCMSFHLPFILLLLLLLFPSYTHWHRRLGHNISRNRQARSPCGCVFSIPLLTQFHNVIQANTSSISPSSSSAARPTLNDVASILKHQPLDDQHLSHSLTLFARYKP